MSPSRWTEVMYTEAHRRAARDEHALVLPSTLSEHRTLIHSEFTYWFAVAVPSLHVVIASH